MPHQHTDAHTVRPRGLGQRLRVETAGLHRAAEDSLGIPDSIADITNYTTLLRTSLRFYAAAQAGFDDARWVSDWPSIGLAIDQHDRTGSLRDDLRELGVDEPGVDEGVIDAAGSCQAFDSFADALGWLYVVEGSALGGRFIAPAIVAAIGPVPCRFYLGAGREHPAEWRSLQSALGRFELGGGDADAVVAGASRAFGAFARTVTTQALVTTR